MSAACCVTDPPVKTQVSFSSWNQEGPESTSSAVNTLYMLSHTIAKRPLPCDATEIGHRETCPLFLLYFSMSFFFFLANFNLYPFVVMNHEYNRFSDYCESSSLRVVLGTLELAFAVKVKMALEPPKFSVGVRSEDGLFLCFTIVCFNIIIRIDIPVFWEMCEFSLVNQK